MSDLVAVMDKDTTILLLLDRLDLMEKLVQEPKDEIRDLKGQLVAKNSRKGLAPSRQFLKNWRVLRHVFCPYWIHTPPTQIRADVRNLE